MDLTTLVIQAIFGAAGGNIAGLLNKAKSMGPMLNTALGVVGGIGGGQLLGGSLSGLIANETVAGAAASGVVGLLLPLIGGMLKKKST